MLVGKIFLKSGEVSMLKNICGVLIYPQFYDQIYRRLKMLPHTYIYCYVGTKGGELLK